MNRRSLRRFARRLALPLFLAPVLALALACGSDDDSGAVFPTVTPPGAAADNPAVPTATVVPGDCTPADSPIALIERSGNRSFSSAPEMVIDPAKSYTARMVTSKGEIVIELNAAEAPVTVNNFVFLSCSGYYDGIYIHRVEAGFVMQAGDPGCATSVRDSACDSAGGPGYTIPDEVSPNLKHEKGVISMAKTAQPNSAGSQFFITLAATPQLDGGYAVFGKVTSGIDVVDSIAVGDRILSVSIAESQGS